MTVKTAAKPPVGAARSIERVEDAALLTGRGRFIDDLGVRPDTLHAAILRSPHAHAAIRGIDTAAALQRARRRRGADRRRRGRGCRRPLAVGVRAPMQMLADRGRPRALCRRAGRGGGRGGPLPRRGRAGTDRGRLRAAAGRGRSDGSARPRSVLLHDGAEVERRQRPLVPLRRSRRRVRAGRAPRRASRSHYPRNSCTPIESYGVVAEYEPGEDGYDVLANFMGPFTLHAVMARALKVPGNRFRLRTPPDSGGSFGVKQGVFPYVVLMALAARSRGRAGEMDRGPAGASGRVGVGHRPRDQARSRGRRRRPRHSRCATTRSTTSAPTSARRSRRRSTACTATSPAPTRSATSRCATAWC